MAFDFLDYELPPGLIAQTPYPQRDQARLLVVNRATGKLTHHRFDQLPALLAPGDLLIRNDTRVLPARLLGQRVRTGGKWEGLFVRELAGGLWELMARPGRLPAGEEIAVEPPPLRLRLLRRTGEGFWQAAPEPPGPAHELLERHGQVPLPPYVRKGRAGPEDRERYQTVYACRPGAVAAPTAGLHFTPGLFEALAQRGIGSAAVTLHVGPGTFQPIQAQDVIGHRMHAEWGELPESTARAIEACRARGGRAVAIGTTSVRLLETAASPDGVRPWSGQTALFIYPPYAFGAVDALVTNFHLPRSTLLLLVAAFAGVDLLRRAYRTAIDQGYRFYSYGDAMLIL